MVRNRKRAGIPGGTIIVRVWHVLLIILVPVALSGYGTTSHLVNILAGKSSRHSSFHNSMLQRPSDRR
ncbi:MAG: hypothetical protein OEW48_10965, partial [Phycisphaerae bacterium]|nr:hypothetical protein [Phycisphaerae bacterium]